MPRVTASGVGSQFTTLERTQVPSSVLTMAETNGTGIPGAARWTMLNDLRSPVDATAAGAKPVPPQRAQALRRSK